VLADIPGPNIADSTISLIIPARNEELHLPGCLAAIAAAERFAGITCEKIVVLNRCTDNTELVAKQHGCLIVHEEAKNLSKIRNAGVRAAGGAWIVTIDADSRMSERALSEICRLLSDEKIIGGGCMILPERYSLGIILTACVLLPFILFERLSGGMFWFRRADFELMHGFDEEFVSVEDIDFARRLKRLGRATKRKFTTILRAWIVTSCRKFDRFGDWYFLINPTELLSIFKGRNQKLADKVWYEF